MIEKKYRLPVAVFILTFILLAFVQLKVARPMILAEQFISGGGWAEIFLIAAYGAFVIFKMQDPLKVPRWRKITWTIFSFVFFSQLFIGLSGFEKFLMTGKLHLPIPMLIIGGPIYRGQLSVMTILFISTVVLTGPAWCSQLCYFGAFDNLASGGKTSREFRMYIDTSCTLCMNCTKFCKYDALNPIDIKNSKPAITCTLCGDCLAGCHHNSIKYKYFNLRPELARNLYLVLTISLHASCIALARI
jgi:ferredoxin